MAKFLVIFILTFSFSSCSNFKINSTICENIGVGSEPSTQNGIPSECKNYNKEEAYKAYDKADKKEKPDVKDLIEFDKDKKKEE